jgi:hypothetical protein
MPDYSIRRHLLSDRETSRLQELGAELGPRSLLLRRNLSRREMLEIWVILSILRERTNDDENHILFAVGDWLNAASVRFGSFLALVSENGIPRPRVLISYKQDPTRDGWVRKLCRDLRESWGVDVRLDEFEVDYGRSFSDYMTSEIDRDSDALLFVITPASVAAVDDRRSGAVHFEMQLANARRLRDPGFRIIGIYREGAETPSYLRDHRYIDFRDDRQYDGRLQELALSLWGQRSKPGLAAAPPPGRTGPGGTPLSGWSKGAGLAQAGPASDSGSMNVPPPDKHERAVAAKLQEHSKVMWPPNPARVVDPTPGPTPGPGDYADAVLREVCPRIPGEMSVDLRVARPGGRPEEPLAVDVKDIAIREPLARLLERHKGKTITELGELPADF